MINYEKRRICIIYRKKSFILEKTISHNSSSFSFEKLTKFLDNSLSRPLTSLEPAIFPSASSSQNNIELNFLFREICNSVVIPESTPIKV